jgi:Tol biopolymer transport system component/serine/threonine protein kinase
MSKQEIGGVVLVTLDSAKREKVMDDLIGQTLNRYKILDRIAQGGTGAIYRAYDNVLQRDVAIKVMRPEFAQQARFRERFLAEARALARLDHPSIVKVHDFGESKGLLYIVIEYIPGNNLQEILKLLRGQNRWVILTEGIQIVQQVGQALDYARKQGLLHRDIHPSNLMLKQETGNDLPYRIVLTDLGLSQVALESGIAEGEAQLDQAGYASPEETQGLETDARSDVYSLGVLLYELAVGRAPFPAQTMTEAASTIGQSLTRPRAIRPDLPIALERVVLTALEKDPTRRYATISELNQALENVSHTIQQAAHIPYSEEDTVSLADQDEYTQASTLPIEDSFSKQEDLQRYVIEIHPPDGSVEMVKMKSGGLTIGRDEENDITLDNSKVSRRHARVQYDQGNFWVSDLNSRNGTFIGTTRLIPGEPENWNPGQSMKIGDARLQLKESGTAISTSTLAAPAVTRASRNEHAHQPITGSEDLVVIAETVHLSVTPGNSTIASFIIQNKGDAIDHYRIGVEGIPSSWIPAPPPALQILPGDQQEVKLIIQPPQAPSSRPGRYPITVQVNSHKYPGRSAQTKLTLTVGVFSRFNSDMRPRRVHSDENILVTVQNLGNAQDTFTIEMMDPSNELVFHPPQTRLVLGEGEMATTEFLGTPRNRRIIGSPRINPFTAKINSSSGENKTHTGELSHTGIIPPVAIPILIVLCLCLAALATYGYFDILARPTSARQTALAATQAAAVTEAALLEANQATIQAATETANYLFSLTLTALPTPVLATPSETPTPIIIVVTPTLPPTPVTPTPTDTQVVIIVTATAEPSLTPTPPSPTPVTPTADPTPLGGSLLIEYASNRDGNFEIYAMLGDGTAQTRVTNNPGADDISPDLSADFTRTVFVSNRDGNLQIYAMNSNGSDQIRLTNNTFNDYGPTWSQDGARIAFISDRDGSAEVYVMNADGSGQTRLTTEGLENDNPSWSPDGGRIVFDTIGPTGRYIRIMAANGTAITDLTGPGSDNFDPVISPDGQRIAFISNRDGSYDLYLMNVNGTNVTRLTNMPQSIAGPSWSQDGQYIAFYTSDPAPSEVFRIRIDGSDLRNLTNTPSNDIEPSW